MATRPGGAHHGALRPGRRLLRGWCPTGANDWLSEGGLHLGPICCPKQQAGTVTRVPITATWRGTPGWALH